jgi:PAS domain S-box-containing protein
MAVRDAETARALLGAMRSGLLAVDAQGRVSALSPEGARILGLGAPAAEIGRSAAAVLARHERLRVLLAEALLGAEHPSRAEVALATEGGEPRTLGFTLAPVRDACGAITGAALWFRDLTPFERMDEQERLQGRLAALGHMAAGLAHELRNPLASIELLAGLAKRKLAGDADACALLEELLAEVRGMAEIVRASLDFVRPASPSRRDVRVRAALEEALRQARARVAFDGEVSLDCDASLRACVDPEHLRRILVNLIGNACEAMAEAPPGAGRRLHVAARADAGALALVVADSGPGVAPELRERIFYPFFTTRAEGSGVGLAEVQKLAAAHGGSVRVDEAPGGGARFHVLLPGAAA